MGQEWVVQMEGTACAKPWRYKSSTAQPRKSLGHFLEHFFVLIWERRQQTHEDFEETPVANMQAVRAKGRRQIYTVEVSMIRWHLFKCLRFFFYHGSFQIYQKSRENNATNPHVFITLLQELLAFCLSLFTHFSLFWLPEHYFFFFNFLWRRK